MVIIIPNVFAVLKCPYGVDHGGVLGTVMVVGVAGREMGVVLVNHRMCSGKRRCVSVCWSHVRRGSGAGRSEMD